MKGVMRFIAGSKDYGFKIAPKKAKKNSFKWNIVDCAGDKEDCHSVSGYVIFILDVPMWKLKSQKSVPFSSSKAEYFALSEAAKDVKFIVMVLQSLGIKVLRPQL
jgi:hypothetical protein